MADDVDPDWLTAGDADHTDPADVAAYYDQWAAAYNADIDAWDYRAPLRAAALLTGHAGDVNLVVDAGCGTGLGGIALRGAGYAGELHGVDISQASLDLARESGAYQQLSIGNLQEPLAIADDTYDALLCVGVMTYVPQVRECWTEFCRIVKSSGVIVVTQREDHWRDRDCQQITDDLAAAGRWSPLEISDAEPYLPNSPSDLAAYGVHYVAARVG